jgi:GT2 family glycosyltransferase
MRREAFEKVVPPDERFGIGMFEGDDYAIRTRRSRIACALDSIIHHWMKAACGRPQRQNTETLLQRNRSVLGKKENTRWVSHSSILGSAADSGAGKRDSSI